LLRGWTSSLARREPIDAFFDMTMAPTPVQTAACVVLFAARLTSIGAPALNEGITEARLVTSQEFENMLRNAEITDSFSVACYLHARLRGLL
jgi:hypothetical protein